jgi:hypothetical protein
MDPMIPHTYVYSLGLSSTLGRNWFHQAELAGSLTQDALQVAHANAPKLGRQTAQAAVLHRCLHIPELPSNQIAPHVGVKSLSV